MCGLRNGVLGFLWIYICIIPSFVLGQVIYTDKIQIRIIIEKNVYSEFEQIPVIIEVENKSDTNIDLGPIMTHLTVKNITKDWQYSCCLKLSALPSPLIPGGEEVCVGNLLDNYSMIRQVGDAEMVVLATGVYEVYYERRLNNQLAVKSNIARFTIKKNISEDLRAFEVYKQARTLENKDKWVEAVQTYEVLLGLYPDSHFSMKSCNRILRISAMMNPDMKKFMKYSKKLLEEKPHITNINYLVYDIIEAYTTEKNMAGAKVYLDSLSKKTQNVNLRNYLIEVAMPKLELQVK
ncbi:hypothetical protein KAR48_13275 [bacterium]|nr:hypothetical protein [bacterium]